MNREKAMEAVVRMMDLYEPYNTKIEGNTYSGTTQDHVDFSIELMGTDRQNEFIEDPRELVVDYRTDDLDEDTAIIVTLKELCWMLYSGSF